MGTVATAEIAQILAKHSRPSCPTGTEFVWTSPGMFVMEEAMSERVLIANGRGERTVLRMLVRARTVLDFLSVYVDNTKMAGKKHNLEPTWERLVKR